MKTYNSVAQMKLSFLQAGQKVETVGFTTPGDGGEASYLIEASQSVDGFGSHELAGSTVAILQPVNGVPNAKQFGATGDGIVDDTAALQAAISFSNETFIPAGEYRTTDTLVIVNRGKSVYGAGIQNTLIRPEGAIDAIVMGNHNGTTSSGAMLSLGDLTVKGFDTIGSTGIRLGALQSEPGAKSMTGTLERVECVNLDVGLNPQGNQGTSFFDCDFRTNRYGMRNVLLDPVAFSTASVFTNCRFSQNTINGAYLEAAWMYTFLSCTIEVNTMEGMRLIKRDGVQMGPVNFEGCFFEANCAGGTGIAQLSIERPEATFPNAIRITGNVFNGASNVDNFHLSLNLTGLFFDQNSLTGTAAAQPIKVISASGTVMGTTGAAFDNLSNLSVYASSAAPSTDLILKAGQGVDFSAVTPVAGSTGQKLVAYEEFDWTPVLTFATPGDLDVVYVQQRGTGVRIGRQITLNYEVTTSTFIHTTASGAMNITGSPFTATSQPGQYGAVGFSGITKAGYTNFSGEMEPSTNIINYKGSGSGVSGATVNFADMPTGTSIVLRGTVTFFI